MVNRPPTKWNTAQRMLLIKERILYPSDEQTQYQGRRLPFLPRTGQQPAMATETGEIGFNVTGRSASNPNVTATQQVAPPRTVTEPVRFGDERSQGERTLAFRPTGQRRYKEGEQIREVDQRPFYSPRRIGQEYRESKILGEKGIREPTNERLTDPKTGQGRAIADLPDEPGRARTRKLQDAFKNQQRFLERLSREGKTIPEGFGEFSGLHPSALLSRLRDNPQALLFAGKGDQRMPVKRPVFGPGGQLERISARHGKDGYKRFMDNPLESFLTGVQGSKLNPANWGSPGTTEYKTRRAQSEALKARMALLMETEKRKIANPAYQSPSNVKTQNAAFIRDLVANEASPEARAMLNVLARDPTMQEINERIKAEGRDKRVAEGRERREKQKEFRFDNPKYLRYGELGEYLQDRDDLPFKTTGANQQQILGRWQEVANLLERGVSPDQIQRILPPEYFLGNEKAKGKGKKTKDKEVEEEQAPEEQVEEEQAPEEGQADDKEPDIAEEYRGLPKNVGFTGKGEPRIRDLNSTIREMGGTPEGTREEKIDQLRYLMNNEPASAVDQTEEDAEPASGELSEEEEEEIADAKANKRAAREKQIATNRKQMTGVFGAMTSGKGAASSDDAQEFMAFANDDPNIKMQRQGGFHLTTPDKKTLKFGVATSRAIASGSGKYKLDDQANKNRAQNEVLKDALTKTGVWDTLKPEVRTNVSTGSDLSHWGNIFRELTGAELSEYGVTAGDDDDPDMFLSGEPMEPIDMAWAILKGL